MIGSALLHGNPAEPVCLVSGGHLVVRSFAVRAIVLIERAATVSSLQVFHFVHHCHFDVFAYG